MQNHQQQPYQALLIAPFGGVGILADEHAVFGLNLLTQPQRAIVPKKNTIAHLACVQLMAYFDNAKYQFDIPIRLAGSKHQLDVWQAMREINAGQTRTYGEIANGVGSNARAVGTACGRNPIPIVVPCHRIIAANGLGGFMGGKREAPMAIKHWLLTHEGVLSEIPRLL